MVINSIDTPSLRARQNTLRNYTRSGYPGCRPQRLTCREACGGVVIVRLTEVDEPVIR